jgi:hypothetical protein
VHKLSVVGLQRPVRSKFWAVKPVLSAYNEVPTFAVAKRLLVQGASYPDAPFFMLASFYFNHLKHVIDESHQKFFHHCAH